MNYLLDTSVLVDLLRSKNAAWGFWEDHKGDRIMTSWICAAEIFEGIYREPLERVEIKKDDFQKIIDKFTEVIEFNSDEADTAGRVKSDKVLRQSPIGDMDILIAATAISCDATLVTGNAKRFSKIPGLKIAAV
jgi:tRNA(fMet)-specific endonuclease VapC